MGKSKPKVEVTEYYMSDHFGICIGPVDALKGIVIKEKTVWEGSQTDPGAIEVHQPDLFGGVKKEGGVSGLVTYLPGRSDQLLPDFHAGRLGRGNGENCPAYRGIASIFFTGRGAPRDPYRLVVGGGITGVFTNIFGAVISALSTKSANGRAGFYWTANTPYLPGVWAKVMRKPVGLNPAYAMVPAGSGDVDETTSEDFSGGLTPYSVSAGTGAGFSIVTDSYGPCLQVAPGSAPREQRRRAIGAGSFSEVHAKFKVTASGSDDYGYMLLRDQEDNPVFTFIAGREAAFDPLRRPTLAFIDQSGAPGNPIGAGSITLNHWYQLDVVYDAGAESFTATLTDIDTGTLFGTITIPVTSRSGIEYLAFESQNSSGSGTVRWDSVEIVVQTGNDANPAHIIYESLTNTTWGMGSPAAALDYESFDAASKTLYSEGFGLSLLWTRQSKIEDFVQEILDHIQGVLYVDPSTGLLTLSLVRGDYDPDDLDELTPDNCDLTNFSRKLWGDIVNEIIVTWTNPENEQEETITVQDDASIATQGGVVSDSRNYYGVRNPQLAMNLAMRDLRSAGQPLASCSAEVSREFWNKRPASVIKLTWPEYGLSELVMRVQSVEYGKPGDPTIKLELMEDVYGLDIGEYSAPPSTSWEDVSSDPEEASEIEILTLPYFFAVNSTVAAFVDSPEYPEVISGALATSDNDDIFEAELWDEVTLSNGTGQWQSLGTLNIIGRGALEADLPLEAATASVTFVDIIGQTAPINAGFVIIGEDGEAGNEIAQITGADGDFDLARGVLDTVPRAWPAGTKVWFVDESTLFEDSLVRSSAEVVDYKILTRTSVNLLALEAATLKSYTLTDRPWLPNRPANVTAYGEAFSTEAMPIDATERPDPWVTVSWAIRNRLDEDTVILGWTDATMTPETGQTTTIEVRALDDTLLTTHDGLTGTGFNVPDASFGTEAFVELRVYSERSDADGDFMSLQFFSHWVQVGPITADTTRLTADTTIWTADEG